MRAKTFIHTVVSAFILSGFLMAACGSSASPSSPEPALNRPGWFEVEFTDVQTGETFTMNDYAGKVVLVETMAIWCPNCLFQILGLNPIQTSCNGQLL